MYNSGGYIIVYFNLKEIVKEYAMYMISHSGKHNDLVRIKIPKSGINDKDVFRRIDSKEFLYNKKLYDIASETDKGDSIEYYCIEDKNEIILEELFVQQFSEDETQTKDHQGTKIILRHLITEAISGSVYNMPVAPEREQEYVTINISRLSVYSDIFTPPPQPTTSI